MRLGFAAFWHYDNHEKLKNQGGMVVATSYFFHILAIFTRVKADTVPAPIKDATSIQKYFFEHTHYGAFHLKAFTHIHQK